MLGKIGEIKQVKKVTKKVKLLPHEWGLQGTQHVNLQRRYVGKGYELDRTVTFLGNISFSKFRPISN